MFPNPIKYGMRCALLALMLLGGALCIGCGNDENEIDIPETPLPIPGPEARLSRQLDDSASGVEQKQTAPEGTSK